MWIRNTIRSSTCFGNILSFHKYTPTPDHPIFLGFRPQTRTYKYVGCRTTVPSGDRKAHRPGLQLFLFLIQVGLSYTDDSFSWHPSLEHKTHQTPNLERREVALAQPHNPPRRRKTRGGGRTHHNKPHQQAGDTGETEKQTSMGQGCIIAARHLRLPYTRNNE
jgi:hypothetical protein